MVAVPAPPNIGPKEGAADGVFRLPSPAIVCPVRKSTVSRITRPNLQSLTAFCGCIAALEFGGGKLLALSSHCLSDTISIFRSASLTGGLAAVPQSIMPRLEVDEFCPTVVYGDVWFAELYEGESGVFGIL